MKMMRSGLDPAEEREGPIFLGFTNTFSMGMLQISGEPSGLFVSGGEETDFMSKIYEGLCEG